MSSPTRPLYLLKYRYGPNIRAHFALFIPNASHNTAAPKNETCLGTIIQATGNRMQGYSHEFKRNYDPADEQCEVEIVLLGHIENTLITDPPDTTSRKMYRENVAIGLLDAEALNVPTPGPVRDLRAPVNDTTNRRCQEWTMEFLRHIAAKGWIGQGAVDIAQKERDAPDFGVGRGLRSIA